MTEICDWDDFVERDGLFYKKFTNIPFTGDVTGKEQGKLKDGKKDGPWVNDHPMEKGTYKDGRTA